MRRIKLPRGGVGRDYVLVQLKINGDGPYDFMLDSGLTAELITPELRQHLGIRGSKGKVAGLAAGGSSAAGDLVQLKGASLCCGDLPGLRGSAAELPLPPMNAVVLDFPQAHLDPEHDPVEGMLGMEVLQLFDTDLDFDRSRVRLWQPGAVGALAERQGLVEVPAAVLNETGVLGIRITSRDAASPQPCVGIVDCGASFSAVNWAAARLLGLTDAAGNLRGKKGPDILSLGVDGRPVPYPTTSVSFSFAGNPLKDPRTGQLSFEPPPRGFKPWAPVMAAVGDLPVFSQLLGDGRTPFTGPAALIGLDVWGQRRTVIEAGRQSGRTRRLFVAGK
uniref:Peptidase A2 domain-containing protein n=1 Tax=Tetradesmus obliquus TaxID=3088 RepID=A0A383VMM9_TETOB|eukprot:jgi/Sobl393_1/598/SZX66775.1